MTLRTIALSLLGLVLQASVASMAYGQSDGVSQTTGNRTDLSVTAEVIGGAGRSEPALDVGADGRYRFGSRRKIVEFLTPPIDVEPGVQPPPPLVTLYSPPELRAKYPPNPNAKTVAQSFREDFGQLVKFEYNLQGPDEPLLIRQSQVNALMSLAGRVYFDDMILLSQDLLAKYFEKNGERFVRDVKISEKRLVGGEPHFKATLIIDRDALLNDLVEKRFIQKPQLRPIYFVFLDQKLNGQPDEQQMGRAALEAVIRDRNQRYADNGLPSMSNPNIDVTRDKDLFLQARKAAQRNNVEIAMSGTLVARPADLQAPVTEKDWRDNTLEVAVDSETLGRPIAAFLPISMLVEELDKVLEERKNAGEREWWDVSTIEMEVPLERLSLTESERDDLEEAGEVPMAVVPANRIGLKRNYYKPYFYTSVRLTLALVRVDNGEIIAETAAEAIAAGETREASAQSAIQDASDQAANELIGGFLKMWPETMGEKTQFKLMATSISPEQTEMLIDEIESSAKGAKVHVRSIVGTTVVLAIQYPGKINELMRTVELMDYPKLRLVNTLTDALEYERI